MKGTKRIGDADEIKQTFIFHIDERFSWALILFRLFVYLGFLLIYGVYVVMGTIA
ncbi:hypothetical protein [Halobacillus litoralis]|uniref:hypothetical protein n=1 Tax=Halobacillus litoralis TaxID=45668 RepID=UPI001CFEA405|nr:hypothetical protein [Halobacillus litoralis]